MSNPEIHAGKPVKPKLLLRLLATAAICTIAGFLYKIGGGLLAIGGTGYLALFCAPRAMMSWPLLAALLGLGWFYRVCYRAGLAVFFVHILGVVWLLAFEDFRWRDGFGGVWHDNPWWVGCLVIGYYVAGVVGSGGALYALRKRWISKSNEIYHLDS